MDNSLIGNGADPALTSALEDQILVDPNLVQQIQPEHVRPPETPVQAQYPADAGGAAPAAQRDAATAGGTAAPPLAERLRRAASTTAMQWASRLPAEFPAYPGGRVTEAAGNDHGACHMRVVTFTTADPYKRVLEHYRSLADARRLLAPSSSPRRRPGAWRDAAARRPII